MRKNILPLVLSFRHCRIKEFKMFAGSKKGAVELETSELDPKKLWVDYIGVEDSYLEHFMLIFVNDSKLCFMPERYTYEYRFEKGVLKVYDNQQAEWVTFAYGDTNKLVVVKGLTKVEKLYGADKLRIKNNEETFSGAFAYAGISSMSLLKDKEAKISWCNVHYTFQ